MLVLNLQLVTPELNIKKRTKLVKEAPRKFRRKLEVQIKQEIQKLLDVGFLKPIQPTSCLSRKRMNKSGVASLLLPQQGVTKKRFPFPNI